MNRRDLMKSLGLGAVAAVALPAQRGSYESINWYPEVIPNPRTPTRREDYIIIRARRGWKAGDIVDIDGRPLGVAITVARTGERMLVRAQGPTRVRIA